MIETETYLIFPTICHNVEEEDASMKLYFYKDTKIFVCYTNCQTMSIFKFLKTYYETREIEYDWYYDIYSVIVNSAKFNPAQKQEKRYERLSELFGTKEEILLPEFNKNVLDCFVKFYTPEWLNDGITKEAMDKFDIRYSISQNKIIIPHYDIDGRLIGIRGRALNQEEVENYGKYMPIYINGIWYKHPLSLNLYGLRENYKTIQKTGYCFLVESEKAVLQADNFNIPNCCVAVCGSNFNKHQLKLLLKYCSPKEIIICFDNEEEKGSKYFNKLWDIGQKYKNYCNFSFVYDKKHLTKLKDSPTDNGEKIFNELVRERVKV